VTGNKTQPTNADVDAFLRRIAPEQKRRDAQRLHAIFQDVTGFPAQMWGTAIIGYGSYHYRTAAGREGDWLATGFSPRKAAISVYVMPGYTEFPDIVTRLGKHKRGKSCFYINKLADVDLAVLAELIRAGLDDLGATHEITPEGRL
jgi:hypothetical protein